MRNFLTGLLSLGLIPLGRKVFGSKKDVYVFPIEGTVYFERFGVPPLKVVKKAYLAQFKHLGNEVSEELWKRFESYHEIHAESEAQFEQVVGALKKVGLPVGESYKEDAHYGLTAWKGKLRSLSDFNFCPDCGRIGGRVYNTYDGKRCSNCNSAKASDANNCTTGKELIQYVATIEKAAEAWQQRAASVGDPRAEKLNDALEKLLRGSASESGPYAETA